MYKTDAHALQAIMRELNNPDSGGTLQKRWFKVLNSKGLGVEFVKRHSEVVGLLDSVIRQIATLPESSRSNYEPSTVAWWHAVLAPEANWSAGLNSAFIGEEHIRALGSLGDVLELRLEATSAAPGGFNLGAVQAQCADWLVALAESGLPTHFRNLIAEGINHLDWLIENSDRFGYARVAQVAEQLTGQLVMAAPHLSDEARPSWRLRMTKWAGTLMAFSALAASADLALEKGTDLYEQIEPGVAHVINLIDADDDEQAS